MAFPSAPLEAPAIGDGARLHRRQLASIINRMMTGGLNCTAVLTLAANAATTTLTDARLGPGSVLLFMPQTPSAAATIDSIYVSGQSTGTATINHANLPSTDRTFTVLILG